MKTSSKVGIILALLIVGLIVVFVEVDTDKIVEIQQENKVIVDEKRAEITEEFEAKKARQWFIDNQVQYSLDNLGQWYNSDQLQEMKPQIVKEVTAQIDLFDDESLLEEAYRIGWKP